MEPVVAEIFPNIKKKLKYTILYYTKIIRYYTVLGDEVSNSI